MNRKNNPNGRRSRIFVHKDNVKIGRNTDLLRGTKHELCNCQECQAVAFRISSVTGLSNPLAGAEQEKAAETPTNSDNQCDVRHSDDVAQSESDAAKV